MDIPLRDDTIRLGQLLKLAGVVDDGAQAKELLGQGAVSVDGEVETRRGRQVAKGSTVQVRGPGGTETLQVT